jgi:hypothetical protein
MHQPEGERDAGAPAEAVFSEEVFQSDVHDRRGDRGLDDAAGSRTMSSAASVSVIECAIVKNVITAAAP